MPPGQHLNAADSVASRKADDLGAIPITPMDKVQAAQARLRRVAPVRERAAAIQRERMMSRIEQAKWTMGRGRRNAERRAEQEHRMQRQRAWIKLVTILTFLRHTAQAAEPALEEARTLRIMEKYVFLIQRTVRKYARRMKQKLQKGAWVRQRQQAAHLIARFLKDHSGLQQGLARYVTLFRGKVLHVQKLFRGYMQVTEGRMRALAVTFDAMVAERFSHQVETASNQYKALLHQYQRTTLGDALRRSQNDRKHRLQLMRAGRLGWRGILLTAAERLYGGEKSAKQKMQAAAASALAMRRRAETVDEQEHEREKEVQEAYRATKVQHAALLSPGVPETGLPARTAVDELLERGSAQRGGFSGVGAGDSVAFKGRQTMDMGRLMQTAAAQAGLHHVAFGFAGGGHDGEEQQAKLRDRAALNALSMQFSDAQRLVLKDRTHRPAGCLVSQLVDSFATTPDGAALATDGTVDAERGQLLKLLLSNRKKYGITGRQLSALQAEIAGGVSGGRRRVHSGGGSDGHPGEAVPPPGSPPATPQRRKGLGKGPRRVSMLGSGGALDAMVKKRNTAGSSRAADDGEAGGLHSDNSKPEPPRRPMPPPRRPGGGLILPPLVTENPNESASSEASSMPISARTGLGSSPPPATDLPKDGTRTFQLSSDSNATSRNRVGAANGHSGRGDSVLTPRMKHPATARAAPIGGGSLLGTKSPPRPHAPLSARRREPGSRIPADFGRNGPKRRRKSSSTRGRSTTRSSAGGQQVFWGASGAAGSATFRSGSRSPGSEAGSEDSDFSAKFRGRFSGTPRGGGRRGVASAQVGRPRPGASPRERHRRGSAQHSSPRDGIPSGGLLG